MNIPRLLIPLLLILPVTLYAQRREPGMPRPVEDTGFHGKVLPDSTVAPVITHHSIQVNGETINYTATTGYLAMKDELGKLKAHIFFIAYTKDDADPGSRPVTFTFNGGPGSSSIWLHMGAVGPMRVALDEKGVAPAPPYHLVTNQNTWLDKTDLVFIDPVSTGYSRPAPGESANDFHGYNEDIQSVGDFIRLWVTKYSRWSSPKFILGESYGTTRAAGLSGFLQDRYSMYLNGIVLVSSVLNFQTIDFTQGNEWPYIFFMPTYATTAWYYKKLSPDVQSKSVEEIAREAEAFAGGPYATALLEGAMLPDSEKLSIAQRIHELTSLPLDYILRSNLRIQDHRFFKMLLYPEGKLIGRYDSRFSGNDVDDVGEYPRYDPSNVNLSGIFVATFNDYVRRELGYKSDLNYESLADVGPWDYKNVENRFLDVSGTVHQAMISNPYLHVWVVCGYFDLATPFFNAEYVVSHMNLKPEQRKHLQITYYEAGHMVYISKSTIQKLHSDAVKFYDSILNP
jgi:carboxypeptidase C (cathepsin A)